MPVINCYVDDETMRILEQASTETGRKIDELAEAAIANAAIEFKVASAMIAQIGRIGT